MKCHETNEFEQNFDTRSNTFISCVLVIAMFCLYNKKRIINIIAKILVTWFSKPLVAFFYL